MKCLLLTLVLAVPTSGIAQTVKSSTDLIGKWRGSNVPALIVDVGGPEVKKGGSVLSLRSDGLWWELVTNDGTTSPSRWGILQSGRWRLAGDTLWLVALDGHDQRFLPWHSAQRDALIGKTADTVKTKPEPDSLFWKKAQPKTAAYKITLTGQQFSLISFDRFAADPQAFGMTYVRADSTKP